MFFEVMTRDELSESVAAANVPTLILVVFQLTGDRRWLSDRYRVRRARRVSDNDSGGLPAEAIDEVRHAAVEAIERWRNGNPPAIESPNPSLLVEMLSTSMGEEIPPEYGPMLREEIRPAQAGSVGGHRAPVDGEIDVIVIGAGISGLCAAHALTRNDFSYKIIESADRVGGTWRDNRYPGAAVDTPSHLYSFSFAPNDWQRYFASRGEIQRYLEEVADLLRVGDNALFNTRVTEARFDEEANRWHVHVDGPDGTSTRLSARYLISAVGAFNPPKFPDIPGLHSFGPHAHHTAEWPEHVDVAGRDVALIGNGASAMQLAPAIAPIVNSLKIFQRSPHWVTPFERFQQHVPEPVRRLMVQVPMYERWYRARLGWLFNDKAYPLLQRDAGWPHPERAMNARSDRYRASLTEYIKEELGERSDLLDKVLPTYPPGGKRLLLDNGWYRMLRRDNVELVTEKITSIAPSTVLTSDGRRRRADVLVLATGFDVANFLSGVSVRGPGGESLRDQWGTEDAKAFMGLAVPGFPNFFLLYGPNTQTGHGGSLIALVEAQMHYIVGLLRQVRHRDAPRLEVARTVFDQYNAAIEALHSEMVWTHPGVATYYRNSKGRVVGATPYRVVDLWHQSRSADLGQFEAASHDARPDDPERARDLGPCVTAVIQGADHDRESAR
jgi:4-hydroxyacetophenone monooxygenase